MAEDPFPIIGIRYLELYVGSAHQTAQFLCKAFGFCQIAYAGLETGQTDRVSYVLRQGDIRLIVTGALTPESRVAQHVLRHGDSVKDIALMVNDARTSYATAISRGAIAVEAPVECRDEWGTVVRAVIGTYGDVVHTLIECTTDIGRGRPLNDGFLPGHTPANTIYATPVGLLTVDHIVGNVDLGSMDVWASYYADVMGFTNLVHFTDSQISTEYTALMSKVMENTSGKIKFPINEPAPSKRRSQIDEYLDFNHGPGVQHIALASNDIVRTVTKLRRRGVQFLDIPTAYYDDLRTRFADVPDLNIRELERLNILADRDEEGYLLQIFTKPLVDRPTLFFEIIERRGSRGFGLGNFKSLFEAIEREQAKRGTL